MLWTGGGRKGLRWCGFALFLVRFCGNFYFNSRYCGFKTLSGLRLLHPLSRGFRWKKVSAVITLFRTVGIRLFCKREPSVLFFIQRIRVHYITLQFNSVVCNYGLFQLILNVINRFGQWCVDFVKFETVAFSTEPWTLYETRRSHVQKKHLFRVPQLAQGRPK